MSCIYLTQRTKKYKPYFFCRQSKQQITLGKCKSCLERKYKEIKPIKNKSNKLAKLEKQRDKEVTKSGKCYYCHKECKHLDPHEVFGGSNRKRSILNGFVKELCRECHSNENIIRQLRIDVQKEFERTHTREEFINLIGKSYL